MRSSPGSSPTACATARARASGWRSRSDRPRAGPVYTGGDPMRFAFSFSRPWRPLFGLFGFRPESSVGELAPDALHLRFGTACESVPLDQIAGVSRRRWPFYYGLGAKLGPDGGVS